MNKALNNIPTNSKGYFQVHHFMTKELGLGGAKLLVYALIYSFTVNDGSFFGSRGYICEACGIAMSTASKVLFELLNDGFIEKGETTSFGTVSYIALIEDMPRLAVNSQESEKRNFENRNAEKETPPIQKSDTPHPKIGHNNKDYTKTIKHTNKHANSVCARAEEDTEEVDRFAEGNTKEVSRFAEEDTGAKASLEKDRVIEEKDSFRHGSAVPPPEECEAKDRFAEGITKEGKNEGENSFHRKRSPSLEDGGCEVRIIHEGKNKAEEVEKLKREIDAGTFRGDIKVPGDIFLEDELIQRKHGIIDPKRNREDDLRCTFIKFGYQGMVMLTEPQYDYLTRTYGEDIIGEYIQRLESTILNKFDFKSYSHYKTILKWLKEDMQCADAFAPA